MKSTRTLGTALAGMVACILWGSCGHEDQAREDARQTARNALYQLVGTVGTFVLERKPTNEAQLLDWMAQFAASTNSVAVTLRSSCNAIWVNTNLASWSASGPAPGTALVGRYQASGHFYYVGCGFSIVWTDPEQPPTTGFKEVSLGR